MFVANTNSDTVSVIDTAEEQVVQTIATQPWPASKVGYEPNGLAMTSDGHLLVSLGRANALAVYRYAGDPQEPVSSSGCCPPTTTRPTSHGRDGKVVVTNTRGIDARGPELTFSKGPGTVPATGHGTHSTTASLTRFALPSDQATAAATTTVFKQNAWARAGRPGRPAGRAVPVPALGDPSTIQHVFVLVKENRTYDQVYGDIGRQR